MKMLKLAIVFALALISSQAFAQSSEEIQSGQMDTITKIFQIAPNYTPGTENFEYQHQYLAQLFGTFIFGIWDKGSESDVSVLAYAVGFVNVIAILLAIITFLYVYVMGAVGTASDASLLGKDNSAVAIPLRTAIGFALLTPVPKIGGGVFSTIQLIIIWVIVTGSNAASVMWMQTVDFITGGSDGDAAMTSLSIAPSTLYTASKAMMCADTNAAYRLNDGAMFSNEISLASFTSALTNATSSEISGPDDVKTESSGFWWFQRRVVSTVGENAALFQKNLKDVGIVKVKFGNGVCGTLTFPRPASLGDADNSDQSSEVYSAAASGVKRALGKALDRVITEVYIPAKEAKFSNIRAQYRDSSGGVDVNTLSSKMESIANQYVTEATDVVNTAYASEGADLNSKLKYGGWVNSIFWFYEKGLYSQGSDSIVKAFNSAATYGGSINLCGSEDEDSIEGSDCSTAMEEMRLGDQTFDQFFIDSNFHDENSNAYRSQACGFQGTCGNPSQAKSSTTLDAHQKNEFLASAKMLSLLSGSNTEDISGLTNPFTVMQNMGNTLISIATSTWMTVTTILALAVAADKVADGMSNQPIVGSIFATMRSVTGATSTVTQMSLGTVIPVVAGLITNGFVLAYVIPFMPVLTWIAMVIGYLLMVIEAVIAAPLAVVMMFTPEGKGIVGTRLQSAINLINACTLRPMLMTLGVIASIQLAYVAYGIFNNFFWQIASQFISNGPIDFIACTVIYTSSAYQICKLIVSAIPKLADQIMQWMASGVGRQFGENEMAMSTETSGKVLNQGMATAAKGSSETAKSILKERGSPKSPTGE